MTINPRDRPLTPWRRQIHEIVFEADTPAGKLFDVVLIASIMLSVTVVMLDSVADIHAAHGPLLLGIEWAFTLLFTLEYFLDLLAILPTYLSLLVTGTLSLLVIRALRLLRVFRVFKLGYYLREADSLVRALKASRAKIVVFITAVLSTAVIVGTLLYLIEGEVNGFTSIPRAVYWAIVTMTTVGYGDLAPRTVLGQIAASGLMILGYAIIAVPTGIVSVEIAQAAMRREVSTQACLACSREGHDADATHCKYCGAALFADGESPRA